MKIFTKIMFSGLAVSCLWITLIQASALSRGKKNPREYEVIEKNSFECDCRDCECVPYYSCTDNGNFNTDGSGIIDIRIGMRNQTRNRRQVQRCESYIDVCCSTTTTEKPVIKPIEKYQATCGKRNYDGVSIRITGAGFLVGESQYGEFPWMAAILKVIEDGDKNNFVYASGGALIEPNIVLTTAHHVAVAVRNRQKLVVRMGEWDSRIETELFPHVDVYVKDVIIHEDFNPGNLHNDFALLILETPVELTPNVGTICLPSGFANYDSENCVATGWGKDKYGDKGTYQNLLKLVNLPVVKDEHCEKKLRTTRLGQKFVLDDSLMCAGGKLGVDTCKGDGGSPLVCKSKMDPSKYEVVGLVAFGIGCGEDGIPGVYADINNRQTLNWIEKAKSKINSQISSYAK